MARVVEVPVARLATASTRGGAIDLVPVTFVIVDGCFVTAVDHKPKRTRALARLDNVRASGAATVLIDHWDDDWSKLWWTRLRGDATVVDDMLSPGAVAAVDALAAKYEPYRAHRPAGPLIVMTVNEVRGWSGDT